ESIVFLFYFLIFKPCILSKKASLNKLLGLLENKIPRDLNKLDAMFEDYRNSDFIPKNTADISRSIKDISEGILLDIGTKKF
ncbi:MULTISPECIES: hypothetical protein, partial [Helicobacter]|uniref:hypothetical protein n=1 Tax=Helicobacter TaxID=209 RepID=UPI0023560ACB